MSRKRRRRIAAGIRRKTRKLMWEQYLERRRRQSLDASLDSCVPAIIKRYEALAEQFRANSHAFVLGALR